MQLQIGVKVLIKNNEGLYLCFLNGVNYFLRLRVLGIYQEGELIQKRTCDALVREVSEEIHHDLKTEAILVKAQDIFLTAKSLHVVRLTYTATENVSDIVLSDEHVSYEWRRIDDIDDLNIEPYLRELLDTLGSGPRNLV